MKTIFNKVKSFYSKKATCNHVIAVNSDGLVKGFFQPEYGSASKDKFGPMPLVSIPLRWSNFPKSTQAFAITIIDNDTVPIIGFPWIHWIVANIPSYITSLPSNASKHYANHMCQGINSFANDYIINLSELNSFKVPKSKATCYGGFVPVNFPHTYTVEVYALDAFLDISEGYTYNELFNLMQGHIIGRGILQGIYNSKITYLS